MTMAWNQAADLRGPQGIPGVKGDPGVAGADGKSVSIKGRVANAAALPTNLNASNAGDGYIANDTGNLHVWSGSAFSDVGKIQGPKGDPGEKGTPGDPGAPGTPGARGTRIFNGTGVPSAVAGSAPGDYYLDKTSGILYELA